MKFSKLWETLSTGEKKALAKKVGTDHGYLHQIATRWRGRKPSLYFMVRLAACHKKLNLRDLAEEFSQPPATNNQEA